MADDPIKRAIMEYLNGNPVRTLVKTGMPMEMEKPFKTPVGTLLESLGMPRERMIEVLSNPYAGVLKAQESGQFYSPKPRGEVEWQNRLQGALGKLLAQAIPYEVSPMDMTLGMMSQIKAYHGSPYKFSKFENKAIGTGEGAQAFGYGHYLTESEKVADYYKLAGRSSYTMKIGNTELKNLNDISNFATNTATADGLSHLMFNPTKTGTEIMDYLKKTGNYTPDEIRKTESWFNHNISDIKLVPVEGHTYETTIHKGKQPGEYTYLEWDKKISDDVLEKIKKQWSKEGLPKEFLDEIIRRQELYPDAMNGANFYSALGSHILRGKDIPHGVADKVASDFLGRAGISGIKYPTGSLSGIKGSKEYNYVVFNPEDITIEKVK